MKGLGCLIFSTGQPTLMGLLITSLLTLAMAQFTLMLTLVVIVLYAKWLTNICFLLLTPSVNRGGFGRLFFHTKTLFKGWFLWGMAVEINQ
jgi:hypothetical protein